jgi:hypothetical protein
MINGVNVILPLALGVGSVLITAFIIWGGFREEARNR